MQADLIFLDVHKELSEPWPTTARGEVLWGEMSNEDLKFAFDLLALEESALEVQALGEIARRIDAGTWLDLEDSPPPLEDLPQWLKMWPFRLLWKQRPQKHWQAK